ncbi:hydroxymethylglutaryl-CoA lyase [Alteraurantiacibacter buctensis]|uniref:Hydroxymethylglutaryl-CoA lyase n=1 Tax=Alteraurantiacibacter buctensis TaxID=1503981 RepID=A0A844Z0Q7_9SPHN|nr:hydroxymethylglutaryl-CoA lyase [Alteraurantiacibacter buctensis]MXO72846.1 hydroxymethylglutaryl-CoA lyase [Alteraurantiacibacter buctensis]
MSQIPQRVFIKEEGPREGFQIEGAGVPTARKIELIDALSQTGLQHIQIVSFVNPRLVPGMADAEDVVAGFTPAPGVAYAGLWLNQQGLQRAIASQRLDLQGKLTLYASDAFLKKNQNRTPDQQLAAQPDLIRMYRDHAIPVRTGFVTAAFGCNFEGDVAAEKVVAIVGQLLAIAEAEGEKLELVGLGDTMAWATPDRIQRVVGMVQDAYPDIELSLHLHDTRGLGLANAYAGLQMGVRHFDAAVAGLGGCPFAAHQGAAGNICTEDFVLMCDEMGIETGVDLERLIECARLAEDILGHPLPGKVKQGGSLAAMRRRLGR